jgi:hypothetical protein
MHVRILVGEIVELVGLGGVSSAGEDDGLRLTLKQGENEFVPDTSIGTGD